MVEQTLNQLAKGRRERGGREGGREKEDELVEKIKIGRGKVHMCMYCTWERYNGEIRDRMYMYIESM